MLCFSKPRGPIIRRVNLLAARPIKAYNGLDTALYKNYLFYTSGARIKRSSSTILCVEMVYFSLSKYTCHQETSPHIHRLDKFNIRVCSMSVLQETNLPSPHGDCVKQRKLRYFDWYSQAACSMECLTDFVVEKCNCKDYYMPSLDAGYHT